MDEQCVVNSLNNLAIEKEQTTNTPNNLHRTFYIILKERSDTEKTTYNSML